MVLAVVGVEDIVGVPGRNVVDDLEEELERETHDLVPR